MKTSMMSSMKSAKINIMHIWNVAGALHNFNGIRR